MKITLWSRMPIVVLVSSLAVGLSGQLTHADDAKNQTKDVDRNQTDDDRSELPDSAPSFELSDAVREILLPLFVSIKDAEVSRATVEVLSDSLISGRVVQSQQATYQIASREPDKFTIYLKDPEQRTRIYNNGDLMVVAMAADAFFRLPNPLNNAQAVLGLPVPMGAYPEPVLALTLAGVDPALSLFSGMKSIELIDKNDFRGKVPAYHLRGVQADAVTWDFWLTQGENPQPLRMLVDLTPMLLSSEQLQLPGGYSHQIRYDFASWRMKGKVNEDLFTFVPAEDATEYKSLEHYKQVMATKAAQHPLLGQDVPEFTVTLLDGRKVKTSDLKDKVVVLDFWTSWHEPCEEILPILKKTTEKFANQDVSFIAINVREDKKTIDQFFTSNELDLLVGLDPEGEIAKQLRIEAIPQTILIGKGGKIESVHQGYPGKQQLYDRLIDELEVLSVGGRIATAQPTKPPTKGKSDAKDPATKDDSESAARKKPTTDK